MIFRFKIEQLSRKNHEATEERLRELGLEGWELVSVLPGGQEDPDDALVPERRLRA